MKIKYILFIIIFFFTSCKNYDIKIKDYFPSKKLDGAIYIYKFNNTFMKGYNEIIKFKNKCILYHRKYPTIKAYTKSGDTKEFKNVTYDYKLCLLNNSIFYISDKENNILLTNNKEWSTKIDKDDILNKKNIKINLKCKITKLYTKSIFGKVRKVVKTECGNFFYFIFAEKIGIIEKGIEPYGLKNFGYSIKLKKIKIKTRKTMRRL